MKTTQVRVDNDFMEDVKIAATFNHRPVGYQVQYWARLGQIMEDNPDLHFEAIKNILQGMSELNEGKGKPFVFKHKK